VTQNLISSWSQNDPAGAGAWLQSLSPGSSRDAAVSNFSSNVVHLDPQSASQWAESISDEGMRNSQIEVVAQNWLNSDETSARAWIAQSNLPNETKTRLLKSTQ
jgi:hypothetical protein